MRVELFYPYPKPEVTNAGLVLADAEHNNYDEYRRRYRFYFFASMVWILFWWSMNSPSREKTRGKKIGAPSNRMKG